MWTYLEKFLTYNALGIKNYTTKTLMTGHWFQCISLIMVWKILTSKELYSILISKKIAYPLHSSVLRLYS